MGNATDTYKPHADYDSSAVDQDRLVAEVMMYRRRIEALEFLVTKQQDELKELRNSVVDRGFNAEDLKAAQEACHEMMLQRLLKKKKLDGCGGVTLSEASS